MKCPNCGSAQSHKNGHRRGKQNYRCKCCDRQFIAAHAHRGYSNEVKQLCLRMYQQGLNVRAIAKFTGICRSTLYNWVGQTQHRSQNSD